MSISTSRKQILQVADSVSVPVNRGVQRGVNWFCIVVAKQCSNRCDMLLSKGKHKMDAKSCR